MTHTPVVGLILEVPTATGTQKVQLGPVPADTLGQDGFELTWPGPGNPKAQPILLGNPTGLADALAKLVPGLPSPPGATWPDPFSKIAGWVSSLELSLVRMELQSMPASTAVTLRGTPTDAAGVHWPDGKVLSMTSTPNSGAKAVSFKVKLQGKVDVDAKGDLLAIAKRTGSKAIPEGTLALAEPVPGVSVEAGGHFWTVVAMVGKPTSPLLDAGSFTVQALLLGASNATGLKAD